MIGVWGTTTRRVNTTYDLSLAHSYWFISYVLLLLLLTTLGEYRFLWNRRNWICRISFRAGSSGCVCYIQLGANDCPIVKEGFQNQKVNESKRNPMKNQLNELTTTISLYFREHLFGLFLLLLLLLLLFSNRSSLQLFDHWILFLCEQIIIRIVRTFPSSRRASSKLSNNWPSRAFHWNN